MSARLAEVIQMDPDKKRALSAALGQIEKQFGKGAIMRMATRPPSRCR